MQFVFTKFILENLFMYSILALQHKKTLEYKHWEMQLVVGDQRCAIIFVDLVWDFCIIFHFDFFILLIIL